MQINRHFDEEYFLRCLKGGFSIRPGKHAAPAKQYETATDVFTVKIRALIDEWLDSSSIKNGPEKPHGRQLGSLGVRTVREFRDSNQPTQYLRPDGETELIFPMEQRTISTLGIEDPIADAEREASRLFSAFMDEPLLKARFAKCRKCEIYYCNQRRLATEYEKGTHCESCRSQVTAVRSQRDRRLEWKKKVLLLAAEAWYKWTSRQRRDQRSRWIAGEVNKGLSPTAQIKKNWVTRNTKGWEKLSVEEIRKQIQELEA
jgi:hypothetical protein